MFRNWPREPYAGAPRDAYARHSLDPLGFLHGRVWIQEGPRSVVAAGLGSRGGRPQPGDERHVRAGDQGREPGQDPRDDETREGDRRQGRPRGQKIRGMRAEPPARGRHRLRAHGRRALRVYRVRHRRVRSGGSSAGSCATTMDTEELPLQALEQAIAWTASHGGTDSLIHHSDHGAQHIGTVYVTRVGEHGMMPSAGTVCDSYDNAMAESADSAYKTELVWRRKPFAALKDLELTTFRWVSW